MQLGRVLTAKRQPVDWKLEFGWRFWMPFLFGVAAVQFAENKEVIWASISCLAAILLAERSGKHIARKDAEREREQSSQALR